MSSRRSSRSRSKTRSKRDGEGSGSESESAPEPSPAELSSEEEEFAESQQAGARVLERAEELEKIKEQQRETREGLAALRQRFEDQGVVASLWRFWRSTSGTVSTCMSLSSVTAVNLRRSVCGAQGSLDR